jgi:hypothetical protein
MHFDSHFGLLLFLLGYPDDGRHDDWDMLVTNNMW